MGFNKKTINAIFNDPKEKEEIGKWLRKPQQSAGSSKAKMVMELAKKRKSTNQNPEVLIVPVQSVQPQIVRVEINSKENEHALLVRGDYAIAVKKKVEEEGVKKRARGRFTKRRTRVKREE